MTSLENAIEQMAMAPVVRIAEQLDIKFVALNDAFEQITFHAKPSQKILRRHFDGDPDTIFVVMDNARRELGGIYYRFGIGPAPVSQMLSDGKRLTDLVTRLVNCWVKVQTTLRDYVYPADLLPVERLLGEAVRLQLELELKLSEITPSSDRLQRHFDSCFTDVMWLTRLSLLTAPSESDLAVRKKDLDEQYMHFKPLADLRDRLSSRMSEHELLAYLEVAKYAVAGDRWRAMMDRDPKQERFRALERQRLEDELLVDVLLNDDERAPEVSHCRKLEAPLSTRPLDSCESTIVAAGYIVLTNGEQLSYSK